MFLRISECQLYDIEFNCRYDRFAVETRHSLPTTVTSYPATEDKPVDLSQAAAIMA